MGPPIVLTISSCACQFRWCQFSIFFTSSFFFFEIFVGRFLLFALSSALTANIKEIAVLINYDVGIVKESRWKNIWLINRLVGLNLDPKSLDLIMARKTKSSHNQLDYVWLKIAFSHINAYYIYFAALLN